jgi:hypothetical protein
MTNSSPPRAGTPTQAPGRITGYGHRLPPCTAVRSYLVIIGLQISRGMGQSPHAVSFARTLRQYNGLS